MHLAAPVAFALAIALSFALYLAGAERGLAAVINPANQESSGYSNAAICVDTTDNDGFIDAQLVNTSDCPGDNDGDQLTSSERWLEIDFSKSKIRSDFTPAAGELDGLMPGSRINLRGTGVNQNEIDLSNAFVETDGAPSGRLFDALSKDPLSTFDPGDPTGYPPTFLLDGGDDDTGLGNLPTSVEEGGILYIPFNFGKRPRGLSIPVMRGVTCNVNSGTPPSVTCNHDAEVDGSTEAFIGDRGQGDSVERFVAFELTVTHRGLDFDRTVHVMTSSRDPDDTLYVVPILISGDQTIDDDENAEIKVEAVQVGQNQNGDLAVAMAGGTASAPTPTGFDLEFLYDRGAVLAGYDDDFEDDLSTAVDTVRVEDVDLPRYPVCERHPQVIEAIESVADEKCRRISLHALGEISELEVYDTEDLLEEIYYSDLEGLKGLTYLDLRGNELRNLPSNVFRDVGVGKKDEIALIDMRFNPGRRRANDGFLASDVSSSVRSNLQHLQVIRLDSEFKDGDGFDRSTYFVYESDVLVFEVRNDATAPVVEFWKDPGAAGDTTVDPPVLARAADTAETIPEFDANSEDHSDLPRLPGGDGTRLNLGDFDRTDSGTIGAGTGTYIVAIQMPFTGDDGRETETFTMRLLNSDPGSVPDFGDDTLIIDTAKVTIRDVTRARSRTISTSSQVYQPPRRPTSRPAPSDSPSFDYPAFVIDNRYEVAPRNPDLRHNIPDLSVNIDGRTVIAGFLSHYRNTGDRARWGYPTSEVLVLEDRTLTQFYQRGVVDFHDVGSGWVVERRLAWDYVGGGEGGSIDQGFESGPFNPNPGTLLGPWGNRVSNISIEGTNVGFADFFNRLGGVTAFGVPKTEARTDIVSSNRLLGPEQTPGFIRQYFQAAIFEYHPGVPSDPVQLALLGDTLRDRLVRDHTRERAFAAAGILIDGERYVPPVID